MLEHYGNETLALKAKAKAYLKPFLNWFGDWTNTEATDVSKVVDENGEPLVVYHRSPNKFDIFDPANIGTTSDSGQYGKGFYFGLESDRATGDNLYVVFLNIKNPYNITKEARTSNIAYTYNRPFDEWTDWHKLRISKEENSFVNSKDGIIDLVEDYEFLVSNPNQIKSIDNQGAFSTTDNRIHYYNALYDASDSVYTLSDDVIEDLTAYPAEGNYTAKDFMQRMLSSGELFNDPIQ